MDSLVIGNTSQLSDYFPKNFIRISSRKIDYNFLTSCKWDGVYLCFGESRKFMQNNEVYDEINFKLTLELINILKSISKKIIVYSTCELWNKHDGPISIETNFDFYSTGYLNSKYKITKYILENYDEYNNVFIIYPFNFNSIRRNDNFLFGKIFNSIVNKTKIEIGNTYFYRDLVHPKYVVEQSLSATTNKLVGSGRMVFVNDFIRDLYDHFNLSYNSLVTEDKDSFNEYEKKKEYYLKSDFPCYTYNQLLGDTIADINKKINK